MDEEPKKSVAECLEALEKRLEVLKKRTKAAGNYAYRGQEDASWSVESTASRRLKRENLSFVKYHQKVILEPARMDGHGFKDGRRLSDLELLANLRHYGAATCLIDFTRNFLVALWFACQNKDKKDGEDKNGKVFIVDTSATGIFLSLEPSDLEHERGIEAILNFTTRTTEEKDKRKEPDTSSLLYWHWSPHGINQRILKQDSLFIFGQKEIEDKHLEKILISQESKLDILRELRELGITEESLFKDMPGFASLHGPNKLLSAKDETPEEYFRQGNEAFQRGDYPAAVQKHSKAIALKPDYAPAYNGRGSAKACLGKKKEAREDFDESIRLNPDFALAYYNRGLAKIISGEYEEAIEDLSEAINLDPDDALAYNNRGVAKANLGQHEKAVEDYDQAIRLMPNVAGTYINRGLSNLELAQYAEAEEDYNRAIELNPDDAHAYYNRGWAKSEMGRHLEAIRDYDQAIRLNFTDALAYYNRGIAKRILGDKNGARRDFLRAKELAEAQGNKKLIGKINQHLSELDGEGTDK